MTVRQLISEIGYWARLAVRMRKAGQSNGQAIRTMKKYVEILRMELVREN